MMANNSEEIEKKSPEILQDEVLKSGAFKGTPTRQIYDALQTAYDHFNRELFGGKLPQVLIVLQRKTKTMGYVSEKRWQNAKGEQLIDELAVNPEYFFGHPILEVLQTLVHEQNHVYQSAFGKPSRRCYHNKEWADKMVSMGLVPSDTGKPGGRRIGQQISDFALIDGSFFFSALRLFFKGFCIPWLDRFPQPGNGQIHLVYDRKGNPVNFYGRADIALVTPLGKGAIEGLQNQPPAAVSENLSAMAAQTIKALEECFQQRDVETQSDDNELEIQTDRALEAELYQGLREMADEDIHVHEITYQEISLIPPDANSPGAKNPDKESKSGVRLKYTCECNNNIWGKAGLDITCNECKTDFKVVIKIKDDKETLESNDDMEIQDGFPYSMEELETAFDATYSVIEKS